MSRQTNTALLILLGAGILIFHFALKDFPSKRDVQEESQRQDLMRKWGGKTPPDFELKLLDGTTFRLADAIGTKVILLNFFATWCGPCQGELPEFKRFADEHKDPRFLLLFIDAGEKEGIVKEFAAAQMPGMCVGIDADEEILKAYDVKAYPTTVLISPTGNVMVYQVGAVANAEVLFGAHVRTGIQLLERGAGKLKENYLARLEAAGAKKSSSAGLAGKALDFARRWECPGCGKDLIHCRDQAGMKIRNRLRKMDVDQMTDEEILKALFMQEAKP